ncbi:MAG: response regulator [Methylococcaceae bacterium]|jgi:phosphoribosyl 1,2-cyclic phosphodiesterase/ActR/RegA family two-component response regulator|nr:response regulator [Methylococcaceae bacterium]
MTKTETKDRILLLEGDESQRQAIASESAKGLPSLFCPKPLAGLMEQVADAAARVIFLDEELPGDVAYELLSDIRANDKLERIRVVMLTSGNSEESRSKALAAGADEVLAKPYNLDQVMAVMDTVDRFHITFWGARGTLPLSGENSLRYGGNTSCLGLDIGRDRHFIFDAGTGLRKYSRHLLEAQGGKFNGRVFITHPHWDHLNCLPFFAPFFIPGNRISLMGPPQGERSFRNLIDGQMDGIYFPVTVNAFGADVTYGDMLDGQHWFDGVSLRAFHLSHPGYCLGYRIDHFGRSVAYITDNELGNIPPDSDFVERLAQFLQGVDVLIHDTAYFDHEYPAKINWGHSNVSSVVRLAHAAKVGKLFLFHHDPEHGDEDLDLKLDKATALADELGAEFECLNACEGDTWDVMKGEKIT